MVQVPWQFGFRLQFSPPLRYVFADVSNRKLATPYPSFLKDPAPWRLRPGPCAAPTLANFPRRFGAGRVGVAVGVPGTLSLRSALQVIPSTLFLAGQVSRKSFVVLPVPNTTELQLVRKGMKRSSPRPGAAKVHTPLLTCRLLGSPALLVLAVTFRVAKLHLPPSRPLPATYSPSHCSALWCCGLGNKPSMVYGLFCFIFSLLKEKKKQKTPTTLNVPYMW